MKGNLLFELAEYQKAQKIFLNTVNFKTEEHYLDLKYSIDDKNIFVFGAKSTFGSLKRSNFINGIAYGNLINDLYRYICSNFSGFEIRLPPQYIDPISNDAFLKYFSSVNSKILTETNQYIEFADNPNSIIFSKTNQKILKRLEGSGCRVLFENHVSKKGYDLLARNRAGRDVSLSLTYEDLVAQSDFLPDRYLFVSCFDEYSNMIAYSVCVKLNDDILYVLYWGEEPIARGRSPVVLICAELIVFATLNNFKYLDIGISSVGGFLDKNLHAFKQRLGCKACQKLIISSIPNTFK